MAERRKRVMLVFGTRPEAIKMCPLVRELREQPDDFETLVCVTGQHRQMLDQVLEAFSVTPDYDLAVMEPGQTLFDITCHVLLNIKEALETSHPDIVLVHGDTTTSFAAALACFYLQIPVGHVEAGLRTRDLYSPAKTSSLRGRPPSTSMSRAIQASMRCAQQCMTATRTPISHGLREAGSCS